MNQRDFPEKVSSGPATVTIYRTLNRFASPVKNGTSKVTRRYPIYTIYYLHAGKAVRTRFNNYDKAKAEAKKAARAIAFGQMSRRHLTDDEVTDYVSTRELLVGYGKSLLPIANEFVAAKQALGDASLVQAAHFFKKYAGDKLKPCTVPVAVDVFIQQKKDEKVGAYHLKDLESRLGKLKGAFHGEISAVTVADLDDWLKGLHLEPRTHNNYRAAVVQLFNFAKSKLKALPHFLPHAAEETTKVREPSKDNEVYTTEEMRQILVSAPEKVRHLIAIRAFSGIRNEEIWKLTWEQIDLATGWIKLRKAATKLQARRIIPILPNLRAWLPTDTRTGSVHGYASAKTLSQAVSNGISGAKVEVKTNALRKCYASYRLAVLNNIEQVAEESGNSPQIIREEYRELATKEEGEAWFSIFPASS